jgi:hypothetical protein
VLPSQPSKSKPSGKFASASGSGHKRRREEGDGAEERKEEYDSDADDNEEERWSVDSDDLADDALDEHEQQLEAMELSIKLEDGDEGSDEEGDMAAIAPAPAGFAAAAAPAAAAAVAVAVAAPPIARPSRARPGWVFRHPAAPALAPHALAFHQFQIGYTHLHPIFRHRNHRTHVTDSRFVVLRYVSNCKRVDKLMRRWLWAGGAGRKISPTRKWFNRVNRAAMIQHFNQLCDAPAFRAADPVYPPHLPPVVSYNDLVMAPSGFQANFSGTRDFAGVPPAAALAAAAAAAAPAAAPVPVAAVAPAAPASAMQPAAASVALARASASVGASRADGESAPKRAKHE